MGIYFFSVRDSRSKILFLYLFITDYTMILWGAAAFLEARFLDQEITKPSLLSGYG